MIWVLVRREDTDSEGRRPREDRGRDQGGAAASPAAPAARRSWKRQEGSSPLALEGARPCRHLDFRLPTSRPGRSKRKLPGTWRSVTAAAGASHGRREGVKTQGREVPAEVPGLRSSQAGRSPQPSAPAPLLCCPPPCPLHLEHCPPPLTGLLITRKDLQMSLLPPYPN